MTPASDHDLLCRKENFLEDILNWPTRRSAKLLLLAIQRCAHCAFLPMHGTVSMA